jgi:putative membrane protein
MTSRYLIMSVVLILAGSSTQALAKSDTAFLTDAIQGNLAEISMGQLAQKNGGSDRVRSFGQMLVEDHSTANEKAKSLAQAQGVTLPTAPKPEAKTEFERLSKLNGDNFDKEFAKHMVADHKKDIAEFEAQAKGGDEVASFAKDTLPTLQKHLQTAQSLASGKPVQQ